MLKRIMTAVIGIPLVMAVIILGSPYLQITIIGSSLIGVFEFYRVIGKKDNPLTILGYVGVIIQGLLLNYAAIFYPVFIALLMMVLLTVMIIYYPKYTIHDIALILFPVFYVGLLFDFLVLIRNVTNGHFWIWLIAISAWGSDTFAYFTGITLGKHKLAPLLSPKKTVEGSIGGVLGAGLLAYIYTIIFTTFSASELRKYIVIIVVTVMIAAMISQIGDLAASAIKRFFNQKDYGNILPGHGGILDRCDSFIFVAPIIYVAAIIVQNVI